MALLCVSCGPKEKSTPPSRPADAAVEYDTAPASDPFSIPTDPFEVDQSQPGNLGVVHFAFDHHNIGDRQVDGLDKLAANIMATRVWVNLTGHADNRGPTAYNMQLGLRRSMAVRDYLVRQGVDEWRIVGVRSEGEWTPVDGHNRNRRVEITLSE